MPSNIKLLAYILGGLVVVSVPIYFILANRAPVIVNPPVSIVPPPAVISNPPVTSKIDHAPCLADNEYADYPLNPKVDPSLKSPIYPIIISIRDKETGIDKVQFTVPDLRESYHSIELHKCGIYFVKTFNYNEDKIAAGKWDEDFRLELWKYSYDGIGEKQILLSEQVSKVYKDYFSTDFRVSSDERYVSLIKGYLGVPEHALVIKSLETKEDLFSLPLTEIANKYPEANATIGLFFGWSKGDRYFWGQTFDGAYVLSLFRIEAGTWNYDIFKAPENMLGGDALNLETGWVTHNTINIWTGETEISQQIKEQYQREGKTGVFALYNLFTKQEIVLEKATDPTYFFRPEWLSRTQLEYNIPSGEKKVYTIQ